MERISIPEHHFTPLARCRSSIRLGPDKSQHQNRLIGTFTMQYASQVHPFPQSFKQNREIILMNL